MNKFLIATALLGTLSLLTPSAAFAQTSSYTSYSGGQNASTPGGTTANGMPAAKPAAVPAPAAAAAAKPAAALTNGITTSTAPAPAGATTTDTKKDDPCSSYMYDMNAYTMCQDRMQKIQHMMDAKKARDQAYQAPAPAPAAAAAPATTAAAPVTNGAPTAANPTAPASTSTPSSAATPAPSTTTAATAPAK